MVDPVKHSLYLSSFLLSAKRTAEELKQQVFRWRIYRINNNQEFFDPVLGNISITNSMIADVCFVSDPCMFAAVFFQYGLDNACRTCEINGNKKELVKLIGQWLAEDEEERKLSAEWPKRIGMFT